MNLRDIVENPKITDAHWLVWQNNTFLITQEKPKDRRTNRDTLAHLYTAFIQNAKQFTSFEEASCFVRYLWTKEGSTKPSRSLPSIVSSDGFLRMYALGLPCSLDFVRRLFSRLGESFEGTHLKPIYVEWNPAGMHFHDIDATPPGILSKLFTYFRLKKDKEQLTKVTQDLELISHFEDPQKRELLSLAVLSHGAAYRELEGRQLWVPSFTQPKTMVLYTCRQHLIAEGVKTISLFTHDGSAPSIYLCQGTELWPSQPSVLGSILANFAAHGSASEAYAHSWRRIHKQLRDLPGTPIVAGHSMGGALAAQIGLYSHELIQKIYAFNPPVPNARDYQFYHQLSEESKKKIQVIANLDDFAFWRVGAKVVGNVTLYFGKVRWKYYSVSFWDCVLLIPAFVKFIRNVRHAFPAHQNIAALYENWVRVKLTQEEIDQENAERITRFDYLHFLPKLYDPMKALLTQVRKIFKWRLEKEYLLGEIEIIALHERDLIDTITDENRSEVEHELRVLRDQKEALLNRLLKKYDYGQGQGQGQV